MKLEILARRLRQPQVAAGMVSALVLAWSLVIVVPEAIQAARGRERSPELQPRSWLLGGPQPAALRRFLDRVDRRLPRGSLVAVRTAYEPTDAHYVHMWCAYGLPRHFVVPMSELGPSREAYGNGPVYLLTFPPQDSAPAGAPLLLAAAAGTLHRLPTGRAPSREPSLSPPPGSAEHEGTRR